MKYFQSCFFDASRLLQQMAQIGVESQMIIGLRVAGMMGLMPQAANETRRMVVEKVEAMHEAGAGVALAMTRGALAHEVMAAALTPIGKRTNANAHRLTGIPRPRGRRRH